MDKTSRPTSVLVIAIIIIVLSGISLVMTPLTALVPEVREHYEKMDRSIAVAIMWSAVGSVIGVAAGIALLKGRNWGRLLYLIYVPAAFVLAIALYGFSPVQLLGLVLYLVILVFLTRPAASAFFKGQAPAQPVPEE